MVTTLENMTSNTSKATKRNDLSEFVIYKIRLISIKDYTFDPINSLAFGKAQESDYQYA
jgi:hypothetical protein